MRKRRRAEVEPRAAAETARIECAPTTSTGAAADDVDGWIAQLSTRPTRPLTLHQVQRLGVLAIESLSRAEGVVPVSMPVTVVGDIHGQHVDLLEIFRIAGDAPSTNFLFLGDYVDRGRYSVETISLLLALRVRWPRRVTLLRGNHESRQITQAYGFYDECAKKYDGAGADVWNTFMNAFDWLPFSAIVAERIFCVHGGLSPALGDLDAVRSLPRGVAVPSDGPASDLLWSDPDDRVGWCISPRGAGYTFGGDVTAQWNRANGFDLIARAHQLVMEGFNWGHDGSVLTLFSAPNYCYRCGNLGAIWQIDEEGQGDFMLVEPAPRGGGDGGGGGGGGERGALAPGAGARSGAAPVSPYFF